MYYKIYVERLKMSQKYNDLIKSIKKHEGFNKYPHIDPVIAAYPQLVGISEEEMDLIKKYFDKLRVRFGIGFTFITMSEADMVLQHRVNSIKLELQDKIECFNTAPQIIQNILIEIAYQIGINKLLSSTNIFKYCEIEDYENMIKEIMKTDWYKQNIDKIEEIIKPIKELKNDK
jgi:lysozyme